MPRPVEALPWGSMSTISTFSPTAASAVARLIAVVVLPTPPFWLATASTRRRWGSAATAQSRQLEHAAVGAAAARQQPGVEIPRSGSVSQLGLYILALEEQTFSPRAEVGPGEFEQPRRWSASPRGDDIHLQGEALRPCVVDLLGQ